MSIRRFRILEKDVHTVQQWLKGNKTITKDVLPGIVWAHKAPSRSPQASDSEHLHQSCYSEVRLSCVAPDLRAICNWCRNRFRECTSDIIFKQHLSKVELN